MKRTIMVFLMILFLCPSANALPIYNDITRSISGIVVNGQPFSVQFVDGTLQYVKGIGFVTQQLSLAPEFGIFDYQSYGCGVFNGVMGALLRAGGEAYELGEDISVHTSFLNIYDSALKLWDFMYIERVEPYPFSWVSDFNGLYYLDFTSEDQLVSQYPLQNASIAVVSPIPEPSTILLFGIGAAIIRRRKLSKNKKH